MAKFQKAVRAKAYIKLAITGTAGSGKTYSALLMARGLVGKKGRIAVIDTENNSSTLYDTLTDFDQCEVVPRVSGSFHYRDFVDAIKEAEAAGYDCVNWGIRFAPPNFSLFLWVSSGIRGAGHFP